MKSSPQIDQILKLLKEKKRFLITSHKDPDGDSVGSQLALFMALRNSGKSAVIINQGGLPERYSFLDPDQDIKFGGDAVIDDIDAVVVMECPELERIGFVKSLIQDSIPIINIDHHLDNKGYGAINWVDTESCAVGELVYFILQKGNYPITSAIAEKLYAALVSDTGNFRFASTTARGMKVAAELIEKGANPKLISDLIFAKASPSTLLLLGLTLGTLQVAADGDISYMKVTQDNVSRARGRMEDSEGFVDYSLAVSGVKLGFLFKEMGPQEVKISVRSQNGVDAAKFARQFNGGGHANAAGFTIAGGIASTIDLVITKAREYIHGS